MASQNLTMLFAPEVEGAWSMSRPGMFFFAGTGPADATCGQCCSYTKGGQCLRFLDAMEGPDRKKPCVAKSASACKYFEPKQS